MIFSYLHLYIVMRHTQVGWGGFRPRKKSEWPHLNDPKKRVETHHVGARSSAVEHSAHNRQRAGSNPAGPTNVLKVY